MKNVIYQHHWKAHNGWRYELRFIPSDTVPLSSPIVKNFPRNAILTTDFQSVTSYETLPISLYNTPELSLTLNYSALPSELKKWIVEYATETESIPPFVMPPATGGIAGLMARIIALIIYSVMVMVEKLGPKVPLANFWIVSTDFGDAALSEANFTRIFEGVQKRVPASSFKGKKVRNGVRITVEITAVHVIRAITESVNMAALVALTTFLPSSLGAVGVTSVYDAVMRDAQNVEWVRLFRNGHTFMTVPLENFLLFVRDELQKWYRKLSRDNAAIFDFDIDIPHTFYAHTNLSENVPADVVPFSELRFLAQIRKTALGDIIGGLLSSDKDHGWGNGEMFANMWDFFNDLAENLYLKVVVIPTLNDCRTNTITMRFGAIFQNVAAVPHNTIALTDFIDYDFDIKQGGNTIRAAKSDEIRMPSDSDKTSTIAAQSGSESEIDFASHFFLHNLPTASAETADEAGQYLQADGFNINALYHTSPLVFEGVARIHEAVVVHDGLQSYPISTEDYVAMPSVLDGTPNDNYLWALYAAQTQTRSGLPNMVCRAMQSRFGNRYMSLLSGKMKLRPDMNGLYVGDIFPMDLSIEPEFATFGSKALLLKCEIEYKTGHANVEFLTIPD